MIKFPLLLWVFAQLLKRQIRDNPDFARYIAGKRVVFQIRTASGTGRYYAVDNGTIRSAAGLAQQPAFTLCFRDAASGFAILSAKDSQAAFLRGIGSAGLVITGNFVEVMWFQGLTAFLQPPSVVAAYDRSPFQFPVASIAESDK